MKKLLLSLGGLAAVMIALPMLSAFEAHVINVTATIENALSVPIKEINFGTVFPQEYLERPLGISLSGSFMAETRVDDVDYIIRQKPKCGVTTLDGQTLVQGSTATGHVIVGDNTNTPNVTEQYWIDCGIAPVAYDSLTHVYGVLPSLCPYLSKHPDGAPTNDGRMPAFHAPFSIVNGAVKWNDTKGHLAKSQQDTQDNWIIDLAVPCFGGQCAQDWASFVAGHNDQAVANTYIQPANNEHKVFGCDLWVEVTGISLPGLGCKEQADLMLVLDRSGSISLAEMTTLKNAAKAFIDALGLSTTGPHAGVTSFSSLATLDAHLNDNATSTKAVIDSLIAGGTTNLEAAILNATAELANPGDGDDRVDSSSPDFIVIITDGAPTASNGPFGHDVDATNAANAADAAGIEIYVVGVGTTIGTANYLQLNIATDAAHYFDATNFDDLQALLTGIASCQP